jgi:hypothetical protein
MPNWCSNSLTLRHEDAAQIERVSRACGTGELLNEFVPVPEDLRIMAGMIGGEEENNKLLKQYDENREKHGYSSWYDFCVSEWGTKWDVDADIVEEGFDSITITFSSAWGPPVAWYEKMEELGFEVDARFYESGMGFVGQYCDGVEETFEITGDSKWVEENIPKHLDEEFGISECMSEWESEQEDE